MDDELMMIPRDTTPSNKRNKRADFFKHLRLTNCTVRMYRYSLGGSRGYAAYLWKIPMEEEPDGSKESAILLRIHQGISRYLSRRQVAVFQEEISTLAHMPVSVMRMMLRNIGNYSYDSRNAAGKALDARIAEFCQLNDCPGVMADILTKEKDHRSGCTKLQGFVDAVRAVVNRDLLPGAEERRHSSTAFASEFVSISDVMDRAKQLIESTAADCLEAVYIPCEETLRLMFSASRPFTIAASKYLGLIPVVRKCQTRTLRKKHEDSHFVNALVRIVREWILHLK